MSLTSKEANTHEGCDHWFDCAGKPLPSFRLEFFKAETQRIGEPKDQVGLSATAQVPFSVAPLLCVDSLSSPHFYSKHRNHWQSCPMREIDCMARAAWPRNQLQAR